MARHRRCESDGGIRASGGHCVQRAEQRDLATSFLQKNWSDWTSPSDAHTSHRPDGAHDHVTSWSIGVKRKNLSRLTSVTSRAAPRPSACSSRRHRARPAHRRTPARASLPPDAQIGGCLFLHPPRHECPHSARIDPHEMDLVAIGRDDSDVFVSF
jgi:hypothetical protein